jgi:hypothetical protein
MVLLVAQEEVQMADEALGLVAEVDKAKVNNAKVGKAEVPAEEEEVAAEEVALN